MWGSSRGMGFEVLVRNSHGTTGRTDGCLGGLSALEGSVNANAVGCSIIAL